MHATLYVQFFLVFMCAMACMWTSEDNFEGSVFTFHLLSQVPCCYHCTYSVCLALKFPGSPLVCFSCLKKSVGVTYAATSGFCIGSQGQIFTC